MIRAMLPGVLVLVLIGGSSSFASDQTDSTPHFVSGDSHGECQSCPPWEPEEGFVQRLFNFRPWTAQSQIDRSVGTPGLPRGRRYYGGRYFGQFNNRFYGPQYGNF